MPYTQASLLMGARPHPLYFYSSVRKLIHQGHMNHVETSVLLPFPSTRVIKPDGYHRVWVLPVR